MMSKYDSGKKRTGGGGGSANGTKLLNEIEAISKALFLDKNPSKRLTASPTHVTKSDGKPETKSKTKNVGKGEEEEEEDSSREVQKDKKSFWDWKPLKALSSHIRNKRFNCRFSLHVHSIEDLPLNFNDHSLCVHWKRQDVVVVTRPAKVFEGIAEFEEKLTHVCSVYGSGNGPHHSAKYEAKHFLLFASVVRNSDHDLGKHRVDLTRLLPLTLEELEEDKDSGSWTTSFKLSSPGKGATLHVSFGYSVIKDNRNASTSNKNVPETPKQNNLSRVTSMSKVGHGDSRGAISRAGSLPGSISQRFRASSQSVDMKVLHDILPDFKSELANSVDVLYRKIDEECLDMTLDYKPELDVFTENVEPIKPESYSIPDHTLENVRKESEEEEFSVTEYGIELPPKEESDDELSKALDDSAVENNVTVETDTRVLFVPEDKAKLCTEHVEDSKSTHDVVVSDCYSKEEELSSKESLMKDLESALNCMVNLDRDEYDSPDEEDYAENSDGKGKTKSFCVEDATESVEKEFLNILGIEHGPFGLSSESEPESPREKLLRQFEKEALSDGFSLFDFNSTGEDQSFLAEFGEEWGSGSQWGHAFDDVAFPSVAQPIDNPHPVEMENVKNKTKATVLEDFETECLMQEYGLNENSFQCSPPSDSPGGFGSPINILSPEDPLQLPPLGEALGPFIQTKNGGFVRSMNPALFSKARTGGSLIMQVSSPVVVPAEMGSNVVEILQGLASAGIEKLSMQANKLMPLEDIKGKTMQQIAWEAEAEPYAEAPERQYLPCHEFELEQAETSELLGKVEGKSFAPRSSAATFSRVGNNTIDSGFMSLEDLAPLAMDKIEALSMEGLRVQSDMTNEDAPSSFNAQSIGDISALGGKDMNIINGSAGLEGTAGLQLMDIKENGDDLDGLMGLSLTLDEWMRMDRGDFDEEDDQISERTAKILTAHHANSLDTIRRGSRGGERRRGKGASKKGGLLGNNFTVALMVQLRDPLRDYEPVGTPMLALIQVERVFISPKPKIYSTVSHIRSYNEVGHKKEKQERIFDREKKEKEKEEKEKESVAAQFKITQVHVAGLKTEPGRKKLWGTKTQQQSGSRWLVANGMGKNIKNPFMKAKGVVKSNGAPLTTVAQPGDTLWSISSRIHGTGTRWKELAALNPHIRNPNIIVSNETIRLK